MSGYLVNETDGDVIVELEPAATGTFQSATGVDLRIVRGTTDTDRTAVAMRTPNGTLRYLLIADDGTVSSSTTAP